MTCGIYKLEFNGTEKCYIGQSENIESRYVQHKYKLRIVKHTIKLNEAFKLYGMPSLIILEECTKEELNTYEKEIIEIYNAIDNGFNTMDKDNNRPDMCGEDAPMANCTNEQVIEAFLTLVDNPLVTRGELSNKLDLSINTIKDIACGVSHRWLEKIYPEKYKLLIDNIGKRGQGDLNRTSIYSNTKIEELFLYMVSNPTEPLIKLISKFDVCYDTVKSIAGGNNHKWLGDKYPAEYIQLMKLKGSRKGLATSAVAKGIVYPKIVSPEGEVFSVNNIRAFARKYDLNQGHLGAVLRGKEKQHKGWKLIT